MLKGIPPLITPALLYALDAMGHGDGIVLADANFPARRVAGDHTLVELPGTGIPALLAMILDLIPLDDLHAAPGYVMEVAEGDLKKGISTAIWTDYSRIIAEKCGRQDPLLTIERQQFYATAAKASIIVLTGERAPYANLLLYKGVL